MWLYTWRKGDLDHVSGGSEPVACTCAVLTVAAAWHSATAAVRLYGPFGGCLPGASRAPRPGSQQP